MAAAVERDVDRVSKWSHRDVSLVAAAQMQPRLPCSSSIKISRETLVR